MKTIEILDPVQCFANKEARRVIKHALSYQKEYWKEKQITKAKKVKVSKFNTQHMITGREGTGGHFYTGNLLRVKKYCRENGIKIKVKGRLEKITPTAKPNLTNIKFRPDQVKALKKIKRRRSGLVIHPTGTGKTIIEAGLVSMFPKRYVLWLANTNDLVSQLYRSALKYLPKGFNILNPSGSKEVLEAIEQLSNDSSSGWVGGVLITTIQSFSRIDPKNYISLFDIIIVDEVHHVNTPKSQYGKVLTHSLAPRRYGFTATKHSKKEYELFCEGMFGNIITEMTVEEALENKLIAKPKVMLLNVPYDPYMNKICEGRYKKYDEFGIVKNKARNNLICERAAISVGLKHPTLIIVEKLEHGRLLKKKLLQYGVKAPFASGATSAEKRKQYIDDLINGKLLCAICSRIWMEGIDVPNLRTIIYAPGMKEKKKVIQAMGRGLRTSEGKESILLIDFLDPYKYLAQHSIMRVQTMNELEWL